MFNHWKLFSDTILLHIMNYLTLDIYIFPLKYTFLEDKAPIWAWIQWKVHKNTFPRDKYSYITSLLSTGLNLCLEPHKASSSVTCMHACKVVSVVSVSLQPKHYRQPGSSVHGILQAGILEWVAISFSRGSPQPRDRTQGSNLGLPHWRQTL